MIGFLRFVGMVNAAVWLGATIFYTLCAAPALVSSDVQILLGAKNFPYFSGAIGQIMFTTYFRLQFTCAAIALLHLLGERLYLGRAPRKIWSGLLVTLFWFSVLGSFWLAPHLRDLHKAQYKLSASPTDREAAATSFRRWHGAFDGFNILMIAGVVVYFWRVTNPPDELHFVGSSKLRG